MLTIRASNRIGSSPSYKWWVYVAVGLGIFLTVMDQSGVNIALPRVAEHFSAAIPTIQWVSLGYVLSTTAMLMPMGRLADITTRKRVYIGGFVVFAAAAALAGSAPALPLLIAAKILQGVGAAGIQANGMAMILEAFPARERGKAVGMYTAIIGTGSITGPMIGGVLVSELGWRSVFFASIPVGVAATALVLTVVRGPAKGGGAAGRGRRFDWPGASLSSGALITFLLGTTNAYRFGWSSPVIVAALGLALLLLVTFVWWELRTDDPMLDMGLFRDKVFSMGSSARSITFLGGSAVFFLMPFYLIQALGYQASQAALMMVPGSVGMAVFGPISGRLSDRVGTQWPSAVGMASSAAGMFLFSRMGVDSHPMHVMTGMALTGMGFGLFSAATTSAIMGSTGGRGYGIATAFLNLARTSANVTGVALATTIVTFTMGSLGYEPSLAAVTEDGGEGVKSAFVSGMSRAFAIAGALMVLSIVLSVLRGEPQPDDEEHTVMEPKVEARRVASR